MKKGKLIQVLAIVIAGFCGLGGCSIFGEGAKEKLKAVEGKAYDLSAKKWSTLCKARVKADEELRAPLLAEEIRQLSHEIRQRGENGPNGTDGYSGPVLAIYCEGDAVPPEVFRHLHEHILPKTTKTQ